jgi:hypothetical protein
MVKIPFARKAVSSQSSALQIGMLTQTADGGYEV